MSSIQAKNQKVATPAGSGGFSWTLIPLGTTVTVPVNQIMLTYPSIQVQGTLDLIGDMFVLNDENIENFSYDFIPLLQKVVIPLYQQMIVYQSIQVNGTLEIAGKLILIF